MSKIWCSEKDCYYNKDCACKARNVFVYEGECITCVFDKPGKHERSRDIQAVRRDRNAKQVAEKIRDDLLRRMNRELKGGTTRNDV